MKAAPTLVKSSVDRSPTTQGAGCPECGLATVNVQGLLACRRCDWTDAA